MWRYVVTLGMLACAGVLVAQPQAQLQLHTNLAMGNQMINK